MELRKNILGDRLSEIGNWRYALRDKVEICYAKYYPFVWEKSSFEV
jgi:hypothetical protein